MSACMEWIINNWPTVQYDQTNNSMYFSILLAIFLNSVHTSYACAKYEYFWWEDLPTNVQAAAELVGYDEDNWDFPGTNNLERFQYSDLGLGGIGMAAALNTLDLEGNCWDYFVNHYRG